MSRRRGGGGDRAHARHAAARARRAGQAHEGGRARAREDSRSASASGWRAARSKVSLRQSPKAVHAADRRAVQPRPNGSARRRRASKLVQAGYRGQASLRRLPVLPPGDAGRPVRRLRCSTSSVIDAWTSRRPSRSRVCLALDLCRHPGAVLFLKNRIAKRQLSIKRAFPDALDLLLICVESGMSIEPAFKKVAEEIGRQSVALAEELTLTTAELSYLQDRKHGLRESGQAHRPRRRQVGLHGAASRPSVTARRWRRRFA